jgi:hypothetical protein
LAPNRPRVYEDILIMSKFRTHWLALFGGVTLLALSMSTAFGARPEGENKGQQVSAFVHSLNAEDEETDEQADEETEGTDEDTEVEDETETEDETDVEVEDSEASAHGQCVAAVAQDKEAVGPPNDNHGGAVSLAAREDCWGEEEEVAADETDASTQQHGKGHGKGHAKHGS